VIGEIETADRLISRTLSDPRFRAFLLGLFAGMALLLAVVGLYGVLSNLVACFTPARRAAGIDAIVLLRRE
jgi:putative ABC transport system permease protein